MCECCWIGLALSHLPDATDKPSPLFTEWSPLRHTTSDGLDRTESVVLGGFPPNHHEEAALVTTAALSVKLRYPAVIEERDQRHIDNPAIKLLDRYIQRFIRQKARDQWRILLESSDNATNPSVTGFSWARWVASGAPPSTSRSVRYCLPDGALQLVSSRIWNSRNLEELLHYDGTPTEFRLLSCPL